MDKLKEGFKKLLGAFKALGKGVRIAIIIALVSVIIAIVSMLFYSSSNKYQILFSGLDPNDALIVTTKLKEKKVDMKVEGETIMVPKASVDELRLEFAPELSTGSKGFELMDSASSFGMTDEEFKIKKLRMQQGELEKTIKSFSQVDNVRVHITPSKDSVFVEDKEPGKAAVYLKLVAGNKLSQEQVSAIVALVSGSTENIPKTNIEVVDDKMNLLTKDLNNPDTSAISSDAVEKQQLLEKNYEKNLEKSIFDLLQPVLGSKITTKVNVDLDFDSKKETVTTIDPNKVIISQESSKETNGGTANGTSQSPVDNNMGNTIASGNSNATSKEDQKTNYDTGKTEKTTISAPGEVKRLTASVFVDGNLDANLKETIEAAVGNAIGVNTERGDQITVTSIKFDPLAKGDTSATDAMNEMVKAEKTKKIIIYSVIGGLVLAIIVTIIIILLKKRKKNKDNDNDEEAEGGLLDVVIDDRVSKPVEMELPPIDFSSNSPKKHLEDEIKKYAQDKPDQVVDIIKSWLSENER